MSKTTPSKATNPRRKRPYRGVSAQERVAERRQQFIDAGLICFGDDGYHAVTVKQLCQQAKLTERYFYESFAGREDLFAAVYEDAVERLQGLFLTASTPYAPKLSEMARAGLDVFYGLLREDCRVARILMVEVLTVSPRMERRAQAATLRFATLLEQMTASSSRRSSSHIPDMNLIASGLIGATVHIAMRWIADGYHPGQSTVLDTTMLLFDGIIQKFGHVPNN